MPGWRGAPGAWEAPSWVGAWEASWLLGSCEKARAASLRVGEWEGGGGL